MRRLGGALQIQPLPLSEIRIEILRCFSPEWGRRRRPRGLLSFGNNDGLMELDGVDSARRVFTGLDEFYAAPFPIATQRAASHVLLEGACSAAASYSRLILPPWSRRWWTDSLHAIAAAALLYAVWRLRQLQAQNRKLEAVVQERTQEILRQRDQIQEQKAKTESLLLNILPAPVAAEWRSTGAVTPMHFDDVTVCFADFAGFTVSSQSLEAQQLVACLHEYFTEFDRIIAKYGLEKLKTIGDAYMFVSGLPDPRPTHAVDAVMAALEILEASNALARREGGMPWRLRIGLHSGPVVAGVVGVRKFAFDIWGDTVNLASRMESSGVPGRVNLSARTYSLVKDHIECEPRGPIRTKDGRDLEMFFANRVRRPSERNNAALAGGLDV